MLPRRRQVSKSVYKPAIRQLYRLITISPNAAIPPNANASQRLELDVNGSSARGTKVTAGVPVAPGIAPVAAWTVLLATPPVLSKVDLKTAWGWWLASADERLPRKDEQLPPTGEPRLAALTNKLRLKWRRSATMALGRD